MEKTNHSTVAPEKSPGEATPKPHKSFGEKGFDWLAYFGVNHLVNLVLSAVVEFYNREFKFRDRLSDHFTTKFGGSKFLWERLVSMLALSAGGHITAVAVKKLEDHKKPIVDGLNTQFAPEHQAVPLVDTRTQTWQSVGIARAIATVAVTGLFMGLGALVGKNAKGVDRLDAFEKTVADNAYKLVGKTPNPNAFWHKMLKVASMEGIAVTLSAALFLVTSKFFAKKTPAEESALAVKPQEKEKEKEVSAPVSSAAAPSGLAPKALIDASSVQEVIKNQEASNDVLYHQVQRA